LRPDCYRGHLSVLTQQMMRHPIAIGFTRSEVFIIYSISTILKFNRYYRIAKPAIKKIATVETAQSKKERWSRKK
jgi:hypothetical protein